MTRLEIPAERLALLETSELRAGSHPSGGEACARELLHYVVTGVLADKSPLCLTATLSALPVLNDGPWRDDAHRTAVMRPYLRRLLECRRDPERDLALTYRLTDYAVRMAAPEAMVLAGLREEAAKLRDLAPVTDGDSAAEAARAAGAARNAAWAAAEAAAEAAARAAAEAAAGAAESVERHTRALLEFILDAYGA